MLPARCRASPRSAGGRAPGVHGPEPRRARLRLELLDAVRARRDARAALGPVRVAYPAAVARRGPRAAAAALAAAAGQTAWAPLAAGALASLVPFPVS